MICVKCRKEIDDGFSFCPFCGKKIIKEKKKAHKVRGNGQGCAVKLPNGKWKAIVTMGYTEDGKIRRRTRSGFSSKSEALLAVPSIKGEKQKAESITLKEAYERWSAVAFPSLAKRTATNYRVAFSVFAPISYRKIADLTIDDYQKVFDESKKGRGTLSLALGALSLICKFCITRGWLTSSPTQYIKINVASAKKSKNAFTPAEIEKIAQNAKNGDYWSKVVLCHIYLGFRPSELVKVKVEDYHEEGYFQGDSVGSKTEAGKNRTITISPKIAGYVSEMVKGKDGDAPVFYQKKKAYYESYLKHFYEVMNLAGIDYKARSITPHSCRHTFATLMMRVDGADVSRMKLIGHASDEMLHHYQHADIEDLKSITDVI